MALRDPFERTPVLLIAEMYRCQRLMADLHRHPAVVEQRASVEGMRRYYESRIEQMRCYLRAVSADGTGEVRG